jgi:hypothetical protein
MDARTPDAITDAERMMRLFPANERSHAYINYSGAKCRAENGKLQVKYVTVRKPVTLKEWHQHLEGKRHLTLGLANEEGLSSVSCVDVDDYGVDKHDLLKKIYNHKLPFVVTTSKSHGGLHVFAFHDQPIPVEQAIAVAEGMARMLGLADKKVEYFPKPQSSDPTKLVKGLNMPHFGDEGVALKPRFGMQMTLGEFLRFAEKNLTTAEQRATIVARFNLPHFAKPKKRRAPPKNDGRKHAEENLTLFSEEELSQASLGSIAVRRTLERGGAK